LKIYSFFNVQRDSQFNEKKKKTDEENSNCTLPIAVTAIEWFDDHIGVF
jgi:hypothetical protein